MTYWVCALAIAGLLLSAPVRARPLAANDDACASAANTVDNQKCQADQLNKAEHELAGLTAKIESHLRNDDTTRQAFDAAQSAWRTDVRRTCDDMDYLQFGQGTARQTEPMRCTVAMTRQRTALLRDLFYVMLND
jgi:uncharacterized protein YecT (DUF1311 family)